MSSLFFLPNGYSPSTSNKSSIEHSAHSSELEGSIGGKTNSLPRVKSVLASHQQIALASTTTQLKGILSDGAEGGSLDENEIVTGNISQRNFSEEIDTISSSNSPTISFSSSSLSTFSPPTRNTRSRSSFSTTSTTSNTSSSTTKTIPSRSRERRRPRTKSLSSSSSSPSTSTSPGISIPTTKTKRKSITKQETVVRHQARDPKTGAFISTTTNRKRTSSKPPPPPSSSKRRRSSSTTSTKEKELSVPFVIPFVVHKSGGGGNEPRRKRTREEAQHLEDEEWEKWNKMIGLNSLRDYEMVEEMGGRGALRKWGWWKGGEEEKKENYDEGGGTRGREPEKFAVDETESGAERAVGADEGENQVVVVLSKLSDPQQQQSSNFSSPILSNPSSILTGVTSNLAQEPEVIDASATPNLPTKNENNVRKRNRITRLSPVTLGSRSSTRLALKQSIILEEQEEGKKEEDAGDRIEGEILTPDGKQEQKSVLAEGASPTALVAENDIKALKTQDVEQVGMRRINGRGRVSDQLSFNGPGDRTADEQDVLEALLSLGGFVNIDQEPASKKVESKEEEGSRLMETL